MGRTGEGLGNWKAVSDPTQGLAAGPESGGTGEYGWGPERCEPGSEASGAHPVSWAGTLGTHGLEPQGRQVCRSPGISTGDPRLGSVGVRGPWAIQGRRGLGGESSVQRALREFRPTGSTCGLCGQPGTWARAGTGAASAGPGHPAPTRGGCSWSRRGASVLRTPRGDSLGGGGADRVRKVGAESVRWLQPEECGGRREGGGAGPAVDRL